MQILMRNKLISCAYRGGGLEVFTLIKKHKIHSSREYLYKLTKNRQKNIIAKRNRWLLGFEPRIIQICANLFFSQKLLVKNPQKNQGVEM